VGRTRRMRPGSWRISWKTRGRGWCVSSFLSALFFPTDFPLPIFPSLFPFFVLHALSSLPPASELRLRRAAVAAVSRFESKLTSFLFPLFQLLAHPSVLSTALSATSSLGWTPQQQHDRIILAVRKEDLGASPSADVARFRTLDDILGEELLEPHKVESPKTTCAYLCYSSGTSGKAKGAFSSRSFFPSPPPFFSPPRTPSTPF
jgi:hypothetical protein